MIDYLKTKKIDYTSTTYLNIIEVYNVDHRRIIRPCILPTVQARSNVP